MDRFDARIAAALFVLAQAEAWLSPSIDARAETAFAAALPTTALAWRRRAPFGVLAVVMAAFGALSVVAELPVAVFVLPTSLVAVYTVAAESEAERAVVGLAVALTMVAVSSAVTEDATVTDVTAPALLFAAAWATGRHLRARRAREAVLDREAEARERAAAEAQRRRVARELHDIVAHRISTVVIQAEAGLMSADDPAATRASLSAIRDSGRQALGELRRLLGLLQQDVEGAPVAPQPSLRSLDELVDGARSAGLPVELRVARASSCSPPSTSTSTSTKPCARARAASCSRTRRRSGSSPPSTRYTRGTRCWRPRSRAGWWSGMPRPRGRRQGSTS